ncbi:MAG: hypothetical protein ACPGYV_01000 [Phycisphaeraceae bacterium]
MSSIIHASQLTPHDLNQLGTNLAATVRRDPAEIDAMNRSLATLGEEMDAEIEAAIASEEVAS